MIKLTALHYKLKPEALERCHNIVEHGQGIIFEYEKEKDSDLTDQYISKPFIDPFEFNDDDYIVTETQLRIRREDVISYKENIDKVVEIMLPDELIYTVKETIETIDMFFND